MLWEQELRDRLNDESLTWLTASSLTPTLVQRVGNALPCDTDMTAADLQQHLTTAKLTLNRQQQHFDFPTGSLQKPAQSPDRKGGFFDTPAHAPSAIQRM